MMLWFPGHIREYSDEVAVDDLEALVSQVKILRKYYTEEIFKKIHQYPDVETRHSGDEFKDGIPYPVTMVHDLSKLYEGTGLSFEVFSPYPFGKDDETLDPFKLELWDQIKAQPQLPIVRSFDVDGDPRIQIVIADTLSSEVCVACHNSHPDSPKTGWKKDDVRGILIATKSVSKSVDASRAISVQMLSGLLLLFLLINAVLYLVWKRQSLHDTLKFSASHDSLTKLTNRAWLIGELRGLFKKEKADYQDAHLLYIDLDGFKPVNDEHGHEAGDFVLQTVAKRLVNCVRDSDLVARIGGDEFCVLLSPQGKNLLAEVAARRINAYVSQPIYRGSEVYRVSCSVGVLSFDLIEEGAEVEDILHMADQAMYEAKNAGKNTFAFYAPA